MVLLLLLLLVSNPFDVSPNITFEQKVTFTMRVSGKEFCFGWRLPEEGVEEDLQPHRRSCRGGKNTNLVVETVTVPQPGAYEGFLELDGETYRKQFVILEWGDGDAEKLKGTGPRLAR